MFKYFNGRAMKGGGDYGPVIKEKITFFLKRLKFRRTLSSSGGGDRTGQVDLKTNRSQSLPLLKSPPSFSRVKALMERPL